MNLGLNTELKPLLLHKYSPKQLDDFEQNSGILKKFVESDIIKILFTSKQSNGKTSILRATINEYYKDLDKYRDNILSINNIKEYGVTYYKTEVKHFCKTPSLNDKKKMIVLDDFDYISEQNQQIFKNIIESFPNIHYLLSCSNPQKVSLNIQSLLHIVEVKKISHEGLTNIFNTIRYGENLVIDEDAEKYVVDSNINQMINNLEKYKLLKMNITLDIVKQISTDIKSSIFQEYIEKMEEGNLHDAIEIIYNLHRDGYSVVDILHAFYNFVKKDDKYNIIPYICKYISIFHNLHEDVIELALFSNNVFKNIKF